MRFLPILLLLVLSQYSYSQNEIKLDEVKDHIGDSVKTNGKVYGIRYRERKEQPNIYKHGC